MGTIQDYEPFIGEHCETNTTGNLLKHAGLELSEAMLYGLGEGLAFGVLVFKNMPAPFIGGRPRLEEITQTLAGNLGFDVHYRQTRSKARAWENIACFVDAGQPVGVKLNMRYLDYFTSGIDFAGHYVAVYGYDHESVFVVDTAQQGGAMRTSRTTFEEGRFWKGPMASNAMTWTVEVSDTKIDWPTVLAGAITANARAYLNPPISNFGARGIRRAAQMVPIWLATVENAPEALATIGTMMERGGTGGGLFRVMYRDFLDEANLHLSNPALAVASERFDEAAALWTAVSDKFIAAGEEGVDALHEAAALLLRLADIEEEAMTDLSTLPAEDAEMTGITVLKGRS